MITSVTLTKSKELVTSTFERALLKIKLQVQF